MITSTGKTIDVNKVKFDLLSKDKSKPYRLIFEDDTEVYLTVEEHKEVRDSINAPWITKEQLQSVMGQGDSYKLSGVEGFKDSGDPILCVVEEADLKVNAYDKLMKGFKGSTHWVQIAGDPNACPVFPTEQSPAGEKTIPSSVLPIRPTGDN
jgi:hypothetical protein